MCIVPLQRKQTRDMYYAFTIVAFNRVACSFLPYLRYLPRLPPPLKFGLPIANVYCSIAESTNIGYVNQFFVHFRSYCSIQFLNPLPPKGCFSLTLPPFLHSFIHTFFLFFFLSFFLSVFRPFFLFFLSFHHLTFNASWCCWLLGASISLG